MRYGHSALLLVAAFWWTGLPALSQSAKSSPLEGEASSKLLSIRLEPRQVTLSGAEASQRFLLLGAYSDGLERDVTSQARFSVSNPKVARVESGGRVVSVADGRATLRTEIGRLSAEATVLTRESQIKKEFSFPRDIIGLFTMRGCNSAVCHGGVKGKGGFKLSLDGLQPRQDYKWVVEGGTFQVLSAESTGQTSPRIDTKEPEKSLLLLKATASVAHGGGLRFQPDSFEYRAILQWIRDRAPYGQEDGNRVERLEMFPNEAVLDAQGKIQILVTAHLHGGRQEDITERVVYDSNNPSVAQVSGEGVVKAVGTGETDIIVRTRGQTASMRVGVIAGRVANYPETARRNFIDEQIFTKLRKLNIVPSPLSSDGEFLRRICLDVTGTLPPPNRVREFLASKDAQKRDTLIETLLTSPEYVDFWTLRFGDLFRLGPSGTSAPDQESYWKWIRESIARNVPYDQIARERIASAGVKGASRHYMWIAKVLPLPIMVAEEMRVFMGRRLDCAQCHNHPYDYWTQDQFWGMAAFFAPMTSTDWVSDQVLFDDRGGGQEEDQKDITNKSFSYIKAIHPRTKQEMKPTFLDGQVVPETVKHPRIELARWMTSHPYFAEAAVNRFWSYFFGRGFVNAVDDFRPVNPPTHPQLLKALAADFRDSGYDLKSLIRRIVQSRTYQLASQPNETNGDDTTNYSHALPRPLEAEVLLDAISQVTGIPETFDSEARGRFAVSTAAGRAVELKIPARVASRFLEVYGRPLREAIPERDGKANLGQALHMLVGTTYTEKLSEEGGRLGQLLEKKASDPEVIEEFYLAALTRFPSPEEKAHLEERARTASSRREFFENLLWALVSSREFAENH